MATIDSNEHLINVLFFCLKLHFFLSTHSSLERSLSVSGLHFQSHFVSFVVNFKRLRYNRLMELIPIGLIILLNGVNLSKAFFHKGLDSSSVEFMTLN